MDVESLAKELILKSMTPEQQMAVLDSVRYSVAHAKEVQKRKIGENVDLVVQALKKIESDIRSRFDDVGNAIATIEEIDNPQVAIPRVGIVSDNTHNQVVSVNLPVVVVERPIQ